MEQRKYAYLHFKMYLGWAREQLASFPDGSRQGSVLTSLTDMLLACGSGTSPLYPQWPGPGFRVNQGTASRPSGHPPASVRRGLRFCPPSLRPSLGPSVCPETHTPALSSLVHATSTDCPQQVTWSRVSEVTTRLALGVKSAPLGAGQGCACGQRCCRVRVRAGVLHAGRVIAGYACGQGSACERTRETPAIAETSGKRALNAGDEKYKRDQYPLFH